MKDLKYLAAYSIPLATIIALKSNGWMTFAAAYFAFLIIPLLEFIVGKDSANLSKEDSVKKNISPIFDFMLYFNLPVVYCLVLWSFIRISAVEHTLIEITGIALSVGILLATNAINVGHELGHRKPLFERTIGKLLYLPCLYMHFYIEHNFGHHLKVATPEDGATARYNQSVYSFWITSVIKQYFDAWKKQKELLERGKNSWVSLNNDMLWYTIIQFLYLTSVFYFFGAKTCAFAIAIGVISFLFLETINYIEHYGLLREKLESGRYERVKEVHSWNSNHSIGRIVLYELTRHSDHHFKSSKKYQVLDSYEQSPELPYGYPSSIILSLIPPLWFKKINPLVPKKMKISRV